MKEYYSLMAAATFQSMTSDQSPISVVVLSGLKFSKN